MAEAQRAIVRIELRISGDGASERAELISAAAFEAGATGLVERNEAGEGRTPWVADIYAPADLGAAVFAAVRAAADEETRVAAPVSEEPVDWVAHFREHARPVAIGDLVIRPSWQTFAGPPPGVELVIDPGQAFGTGAHESTAAAIRLLQRSRLILPRGALLDVGCGSGVLALAARAYGAPAAVAFDLDPLAARATREAAAHNAIDGVLTFCGPFGALRGRCWPTVIANLLRREHAPLFGALAATLPAGGSLMVAGLLSSEADEVLEWADGAGLAPVDRVEQTDGSGSSWAGLCFERPSTSGETRPPILEEF